MTQLDRIEQMLCELLKRQNSQPEEDPLTGMTVDEEIQFVFDQGIDPVTYLKNKQKERQRTTAKRAGNSN